jgi:hypothetical protein
MKFRVLTTQEDSNLPPVEGARETGEDEIGKIWLVDVECLQDLLDIAKEEECGIVIEPGNPPFLSLFS